jgi:hypothetical protein
VDWLFASCPGRPDPRIPSGEERKHPEELETPLGSSAGSKVTSEDREHFGDQDSRQQFLAFEKWIFTLGDRDCYPSVPHGHFHKKTNEWPKLNPYTGRVFSNAHQEDVCSRLSMSQMKLLWNDANFVELCRKQVLWYSDFAPTYRFPRARFGRLQFPRWP